MALRWRSGWACPRAMSVSMSRASAESLWLSTNSARSRSLGERLAREELLEQGEGPRGVGVEQAVERDQLEVVVGRVLRLRALAGGLADLHLQGAALRLRISSAAPCA